MKSYNVKFSFKNYPIDNLKEPYNNFKGCNFTNICMNYKLPFDGLIIEESLLCVHQVYFSNDKCGLYLEKPIFKEELFD